LSAEEADREHHRAPARALDEEATAKAYTPTISEEHVELIRHWHERGYAQGRSEGAAEQTFDYLGISIVVPPEVMAITGVSHLLGEAVLAEVRDGERVLDMGTGSGVNAILAATKGARALAVDINPVALAGAQANADRNGVGDRVEVRRLDVFSDVEGVFDLIVFDPPFRWFRPRDLLESAMTDEGYRAMTAFFRQARGHLAVGGRMLLFFGTSGDLGYLEALIAESGFSAEVIAHEDLVRDRWQVEYFTFKLS
jgi:release factor glutamine methyltransferase